MGDGALVEAQDWLEYTVADCGDSIRLAYRQQGLSMALAALACAENGLGNRALCQRHLHEALEIAIDIRAFVPLLHLMSIVASVLVGASMPQRRNGQ